MTKTITYHFEPPNGAAWSHAVAMEPLSPQVLEEGDGAEWTLLEHCQCEHCPLTSRECRHCPLALALQPVLEKAGTALSHDVVRVRVCTEDRETSKECTVQRAVGSLFGLLSAFSGCPHTRLLRPLARCHLPFSTSDETTARVLGFYLAGQFVRARHDLPTDWSLEGLKELYQNLRKVNRGISQRLRGLSMEDAGPNSMVLLDVLAADVAYALEKYEGELDSLFQEFLAEGGER